MKLNKREIVALKHFGSGNFDIPKGVAGVTISNFLSRGWIIRIESVPGNVAPRYRLTPKGQDVLQTILE